MQFKSVKYYLSKLISDGHKWQNTNVSGVTTKPKFFFSSLQYYILAISICSSFYLSSGFTDSFISYAIAALSIFVGLFLTLMISIYDKFAQLNLPEISKRIQEDPGSISAKEITKLIQRKNFFKQFTALTAYSIILSILCILLLSISLLWDMFSSDIMAYRFVSFTKMDKENVTLFFKLFVVFMHRVVIVYFLLDFLLIVIYAVSSIYHFFSLEYDSVKLKG